MSRRALGLLVVAIGGQWLAGCGGGGPKVGEDPLADMRDPKLGKTIRIKAVQQAWDAGQKGSIDRTTVREDLKTVAWSPSWPQDLRLAALRSLLSDTEPKGVEDNRGLIRLMLPRETDQVVVRLLAEEAVKRGWPDATASLIRSLSRPWPGVPDPERPEYKAIASLNPGQSVATIVRDIFLNPPEEGGPFGLVPADRARSDAWDLLARVDADGSVRSALIEQAPEGGQAGPVTDMRASFRELRCLPLTGDELRWLSSLRDFRDGAKRSWWDQTAAAVAKLRQPGTERLQLRHLEPIRWAAEQRPEWLGAGREELLSELERRLTSRQFHRRRVRENGGWKPPPDRLREWRDKLTWPDLVAILAIDEGVRDKAVVASLFAQVDMDRADRTAEYGGLLRTGSAGFGVVLYPPRPGSRRGDRQFVASSDMIAQSDHALAHYHFHVQDVRNSEYAGPSSDDLVYAARQGRSCLVMTSVGSGDINVDYYQPNGVVVDLGTITSQ